MKKTLVFLFLTLLTSTSALANSGMSAFNRKDYNEAYRVWSRAPDTAESQYGLGLLHYEGLGGPKNPAKGLSLLQSSSDKGYKASTEYLANIYERGNDPKNTIRFLERLQSQEKTLKTQERLVAAQRKLAKDLPSKSTDYCLAITELSRLGGSPESGTAEMCALNGLASSVTLDTARQWLTRNFSQSPTIEGIDMLSEELLNSKSASFNPSVIEEAVWALDGDLSNQAVKKTLLEKGRLSQETCRTLPFRDPDQRVRLSSYCTLVVIAGANKNPLIVAKEYITGTQGRVGTRQLVRVRRGLTLLALQKEVFDSIDGIYLQLEANRLTNKWQDSIELMGKNFRRLDSSKSPQNRTNLMFLLEKTESDRSFTQLNANDLARLIDAFNGEIETKKLACNVLAPFVDKSSEHDTEKIAQKELIKSLESICTTVGLARPDPSKQPIRISSASSPNAARPTSDQAAAAAQPTQGQPKATTPPAGFDKSLYDCNQGEVSGCAPAAIALLSPNPPTMYQSLSKEQRLDVAEKILLNGVKKDDPGSLAVLYDIYESSLDSSKRPTSQKYLSILLAKGEPAGLLRQEIQSLPKDPISGVIGGVLLRPKYAASCDRIRQLAQENRLTEYDKTIANNAYNGIMCKSLR
jgi:hypothetical protein